MGSWSFGVLGKKVTDAVAHSAVHRSMEFSGVLSKNILNLIEKEHHQSSINY